MRAEPIAIIGIGCRFPGASGPSAFWRLLATGTDAISEMPEGRFDLDALFDPRPQSPGKVVTRQGGFLRGLDLFDPTFFGISPREAHFVDPQQRLLLEVAHEAFEDAGVPRSRFAGSRTGVFVGMWTNDYEACMYEVSSDIDLYVLTGGGRYPASGRISYAFDLQGPSLTLDTACSSSLVAVHLACESLRRGESALALAGGVNLILKPYVTIGYSRSGMLAPDGRCKFGDAAANGYVRSEGAGLVLLKPLSQALADHDPIYAVIRGGAVNNDGGSSGLLVSPSPKGQEAMLREAYRAAGVAPGDVQYVEAHGTGTSVGDPVEIEALGSVLSEGRPPDRPCLLGSVKTNIGHTEAAAGIAGLIKAALCLKERKIPESLHFREPNPRIPWDTLPMRMVRRLEAWPAGPGAALAAVNSFGVTGTNAHLVLEEAPARRWPPAAATATPPHDLASSSGSLPAQLLVLSAHSPEALRAMAGAYDEAAFAVGVPPLSGDAGFSDVCFTAAVRRTHHEHRLAVVARNAAEARAGLLAFLRGEPAAGVVSGRSEPARFSKVVFVFPGQGSQWLGMGRELLRREPILKDEMERCDAAVRSEASFSPLEELAADESRSGLGEIDVVQPTLFSLGVALAALWRSWGVLPAAVVGHSMGEVAAAHVAGVLDLAEATRVICRRSHLLREARGRGAMAVVDLDATEAQRALRGFEDRLSVAASNSSRSTLLSGDPAALDALLEELQKREVFARRVKVDVASHSPQMEALLPALVRALEGIAPRAARIPMLSTVTGEYVAGPEMGPSYWAKNLREPVRFAQAVGRLATSDHAAFVEVSPHPVLLSSIQEELQSLGVAGMALGSLRRDEDESVSLLTSLGSLHVQGGAVRFEALCPEGRVVALPGYPWQRERYWFDEPGATTGAGARRHARKASAGEHPLLGSYLRSSVEGGRHFWEATISAEEPSFLADHRVRGRAVFPAAAFLEMAHAAGQRALGEASVRLRDVVFEAALVLPKGEERTVQTVLEARAGAMADFRISSLAAADRASGSWTLHAKGRLTAAAAQDGEPTTFVGVSVGGVWAATDAAAHTAAMAARGLEYGPTFQAIDTLVTDAGTGEARLRTEGAWAWPHASGLHPALLDAGFQLLVAILRGADPEVEEDDTFVPAGIGALRWGAAWGARAGLRAVARLQEPHTAPGEARVGSFVGDVSLVDDQGQMVVEAKGLRLQKLQKAQDPLEACFFSVDWEALPLPPLEGRASRPGVWLVLTGDQEAGARLVAHAKGQGAQCVVASPGIAFERFGQGQYRIAPERPEDFRRLLEEVGALGPLEGVVHLWSLDAAPAEKTDLAGLAAARRLGCESALHLVQALQLRAVADPAPSLCLVTAGAQAVSGHGQGEAERSGDGAGERPGGVAIAQAPLLGLARVIAREHPELNCRSVDLGSEPTAAEIEALWREAASPDQESEIALRGARRFAARLARADVRDPVPVSPRMVPAQGRPFRVETTTPGVLDHLVRRPLARRPPAAGEVEIEVAATGLNFMNVLSALGIYPGHDRGLGSLGIECSGRIAAVGPGVEGFRAGDSVLAVAYDSLATHAIADARLVQTMPGTLSYEEAATLPIAFLTADYGLRELARLQAGERVLIHAAAGGVGLAAVQIAQRAGAEVFATAGSAEKRATLASLGIAHVMDSRSLAFADEVMERTGGRGVDVVLNCLSGEAMARSLDVLSPYGRFVEIGKRDIYDDLKLGLAPFRKALSYFAIDLDRMARERPDVLGRLLRDLVRRVSEGELKPLPYVTFGIGSAAEAFRHMAQARHTGKIVITADSDAEVEEETPPPFAEGAYLVTGGLGGLGLAVADWLADRGARHLVLAGRRLPQGAALDSVAALRRRGVSVRTPSLDVADAAEVARALAVIAREGPPLRGIVHAAGILDDGVLTSLDARRLAAVMAPKVEGAWNLHALTLGLPLDLFVLFSSVSSVLGSPGQGNYAAANAFLDALAAHRYAQGRPALVVDFGPWRDVGLAAAQENRGDRLASRGLGSLRPEEGIRALDRLVRAGAGRGVVMRFDWPRWQAALPGNAARPLYTRLAAEEASSQDAPAESRRGGTREALLAEENGLARRALLEKALRERVAQVLRLGIDRVDVERPLRALGMDSLMALELRNRLEADLGLRLPATVIWNYPTIAALVPHLASRMGIPLEVKASPGAEADDVERLLSEIEGLSDEEARQLLSGEGIASE